MRKVVATAYRKDSAVPDIPAMPCMHACNSLRLSVSGVCEASSDLNMAASIPLCTDSASSDQKLCSQQLSEL